MSFLGSFPSRNNSKSERDVSPSSFEAVGLKSNQRFTNQQGVKLACQRSEDDRNDHRKIAMFLNRALSWLASGLRIPRTRDRKVAMFLDTNQQGTFDEPTLFDRNSDPSIQNRFAPCFDDFLVVAGIRRRGMPARLINFRQNLLARFHISRFSDSLC